MTDNIKTCSCKAYIQMLAEKDERILMLENTLRDINNGLNREQAHSDTDRHIQSMRYWSRLISNALSTASKPERFNTRRENLVDRLKRLSNDDALGIGEAWNALEAAAAALEKWETELSKVMPSDFKDWWHNSKDEWPEIARSVTEAARRDRDAGWEAAARTAVEVEKLKDIIDGILFDTGLTQTAMPDGLRVDPDKDRYEARTIIRQFIEGMNDVRKDH